MITQNERDAAVLADDILSFITKSEFFSDEVITLTFEFLHDAARTEPITTQSFIRSLEAYVGQLRADD